MSTLAGDGENECKVSNATTSLLMEEENTPSGQVNNGDSIDHSTM